MYNLTDENIDAYVFVYMYLNGQIIANKMERKLFSFEYELTKRCY